MYSTTTQIWFPLFNVDIKLRKKAHMWSEAGRWKNNCEQYPSRERPCTRQTPILFLTHTQTQTHTCITVPCYNLLGYLPIQVSCHFSYPTFAKINKEINKNHKYLKLSEPQFILFLCQVKGRNPL